jgi:hypothetical protein
MPSSKRNDRVQIVVSAYLIFIMNVVLVTRYFGLVVPSEAGLTDHGNTSNLEISPVTRKSLHTPCT